MTSARAVYYAVKHGAKVLSNSWMMFNYYDQAHFDAIEFAKAKNVI